MGCGSSALVLSFSTSLRTDTGNVNAEERRNTFQWGVSVWTSKREKKRARGIPFWRKKKYPSNFMGSPSASSSSRILFHHHLTWSMALLVFLTCIVWPRGYKAKNNRQILLGYIPAKKGASWWLFSSPIQSSCVFSGPGSSSSFDAQYFN